VAANKATGTVIITGEPGVVLAAGTRLVRESDERAYELVAEATIGADGDVVAQVTAARAGAPSEATAGTELIFEGDDGKEMVAAVGAEGITLANPAAAPATSASKDDAVDDDEPDGPVDDADAAEPSEQLVVHFMVNGAGVQRAPARVIGHHDELLDLQATLDGRDYTLERVPPRQLDQGDALPFYERVVATAAG